MDVSHAYFSCFSLLESPLTTIEILALQNYAMPSSSAIPRSTSDPYLTRSSSSSSSKAHCLPPSNRSACSTRSSKSSYWFPWSNITKLGTFILPGRKSTDCLSKHSDLTEESLDAHNRRQAAINVLHTHHLQAVDDKNAKCSPYYKGLVDSSLILHRERHHLPSSSSPGRESHATTVVSSASLSSFIFKVQEWSSCFSFSFKSNNKDKDDNNTPAASAPAAIPIKPSAPISSSSALSSASVPIEKEETSNNALPVVTEEKPLRERVSETKPPPPAPSKANEEDTDTTSTLDMLIIKETFTWASKYQPKALKDFICNRDQAIGMQGLMRDVDCNHFIFEGPTGVGKRTMIWAMLQEAFGPERVQTREECKAFNLKGEHIRSIQVRVKVSSQHVEVNLSDLKGYEKHVIVELIKETQKRISKKALQSKLDDCQAIILYEADKLSTDALLYIKWLLERYKGFSKFFFCCSDISKLQPIKPLCTVVQLSPPSKKEIVEVLEFIARQERVELPHQLAEKIADNSKNNLRQAIRSFEATWKRSYPFTEDQWILTGWEDDIANIAKNMVEEQSPKQLYIIRGKLQNLIEYDVSPDFIFKSLVGELKKHLDETFPLQLENLYKDHNRNDGNMLDSEHPPVFLRSRHEEAGKRLHDPARKRVQQFMRIEEFIAKFMSFYKTSVTNNRSI